MNQWLDERLHISRLNGKFLRKAWLGGRHLAKHPTGRPSQTNKAWLYVRHGWTASRGQ